MPYDITDVKEDIDRLYRELIALENILEEKGIIEKTKKKNEEKNGKELLKEELEGE